MAAAGRLTGERCRRPTYCTSAVTWPVIASPARRLRRGHSSRALTEALAAQLALAAPQVPAEGVWRIRRLDVRTAIAPAWSEREIARAVAVAVVHALTRTIAIGADGEHAVWFPDRASFLARYLVDCANERGARALGVRGVRCRRRPERHAPCDRRRTGGCVSLPCSARHRADRQALIAALHGSDAAGVLAAFADDRDRRVPATPRASWSVRSRRLLERGALPDGCRAGGAGVVRRGCDRRWPAGGGNRGARPGNRRTRGRIPRRVRRSRTRGRCR